MMKMKLLYVMLMKKKDNIIIQKDLKEGEDEYNGFTFWRLENQNSFVNSEFK